MSRKPVAIIDVGSNSVRLVVYSSDQRVPPAIFNEKVFAGLGASLSKSGKIGRSSGQRALQALRRFKLIVEHIGAGRTHLLATAAIRDASNGPEFAAEIKAMGLPCRILAPEEEATLGGLGVISGIPWANGVAGDLGGGSLELIEVGQGETRRPISLPLGVLRVEPDRKAIRKAVRKGIEKAGITCGGGDFYMVGGSWRALARIDMIASDYPLPILHQYRMQPGRAAELVKLVADPDPKWRETIAPARLEAAPVAAMILASIVEELEPERLIVSTYGIREGLLYSALGPRKRRLDPLVSAAHELGKAEGPTDGHGDSLDRWLSGAFDDSAKLARIRLTVCLLADVAWQALPGFRADRAIELAIHGNWVGIDAAGRVLMAQALSHAFEHDDLADSKLLQLCKDKHVRQATQWGLAVHAGQHLSGGIASVLRETRLKALGDRLELQVPSSEGDLVDDGVLKRLSKLADSLELQPAVEPA
jgi:exopolyphosphatase/guanosine-5'-triphosphate,3'-diphosphate pyrophosphatase